METGAIISIILSAGASLLTGLILLVLKGQAKGTVDFREEQSVLQTTRHEENRGVLSHQTELLQALNGRVRVTENEGIRDAMELEGHIREDLTIRALWEKRLDKLEAETRTLLVQHEARRMRAEGV